MLYKESRRLGQITRAGFIALALIVIGQLAFSAWSLLALHRDMSTELVSFSDHQLEALELKVLIGEVRRHEKDILLAAAERGDAWYAARQRWRDSLAQSFAQIAKLQTEVAEGTGQLKVEVGEIETGLKAYAQGVEAVIADFDTPRAPTPQAANRALSEAKAYAYTIAHKLDDIVEKAEEEEQHTLAHLNQQRQVLLMTFVGIGVICLVLCLVLSHRITRSSLSISRSLEHQALHDTLTGLLNRRGLAASMNADTARGGALAYIDLDRFKLVNDLCGHTAGDDLLVELTEKLGACCTRHQAVIARVGGDEFAVWRGGDKNLDAARRLADEIILLIEEHHFAWLGQPMPLGASAGLALAGPGYLNREVVARADAACRLAKQPGSPKVLVYEEADPALNRARQEELWAARLPQLIRDGRFRLYGQRVVPLRNDRGHGHIEVLLRGLDDHDQIVSPGTFLSAAERFGLMPKIDRWVIETLLAGQLDPDCEYAVNLSGQTLMDKHYLPELEALLKASGKAHQISFEITESAAMSGIDTAREYIRRLKLLGCRFALDDFGSGFSSFAYLRDLQVDFLKIDGSLVRILGRDDADAALVQAIVQMAQTLGLKTIAEFVETPAIAAQLAGMGVDYGQGYGLHRPEPLAVIASPATLHPETNAAQKTTDGTQPEPGETR